MGILPVGGTHCDGRDAHRPSACRGHTATADAAPDPAKNKLNLCLRLADEIKLSLADVVPTIIDDNSLTKLRVDNVMDLETPKPYNLIHGQGIFRVAGFNMVLDDVGSTVYLTDKHGVTYKVVVDEVLSKRLFKGHTAALLEAGDYKLVVKSRAGDAEGPLQTAFRKVKYLKVAPVGTRITKIQGDDEGTPEGEINEGRPFTITGERLAGATATWACVYEGTEHSGEVTVNSSSETEMKCGGIVPVDGTIYFGDITITVTTADGSATVTAKTGA